jgi:NAD(P)-dependent dehydrogenase (short-subunit alcohol dehydrogenase family)
MTDSTACQVALVTGAGAGIGRACALALARTGAVVAVTDISEDGAKETHELVVAEGGASAAYRLDVSDEDDWDRVVSEVDRTVGPILTLVNNAGYKASLSPNDRGLLDLDRMMRVNLTGPMLGSRRVLPAMLAAGRGSIIMFSSVTALASPPNHATAYSSSKAGLLSLMRSIAVSYGPAGIRCNAIAPGVTVVDEASVAQREFYSSTTSMTGRVGRPNDMASAVLFLASDGASFVNGQTLVVDGGLTAHLPGLTTSALNTPAESLTHEYGRPRRVMRC